MVKILEKIIASHIHDLLSKNKFISCDQHGFQESASCVYLGFAKAFDSVPHKRLILKLKLAGIRVKVLRWIEGFLWGRRQRVVLRNGSSHWRQVTSGVPQGSILGPLLFLIYVNDIPELVSSTAKMFADDTKVYCHTPDLESCKYLQDDPNKLGAWSSKWLLNFNAHKCVVLKIRESLNYLYTLDGVPLKSVSSQKDLGVIISNDLKPRNHITSIVSKANQRVGLIKRCFTHLNFDLIYRLFKAIVMPILEYGSPTWSPALLCDINDLEKVQKNCYRVATDLTEVCGPGWEPPTLISRREFADLCEVYKYTHGIYIRQKPASFLSSISLPPGVTHSSCRKNAFTRKSEQASFKKEVGVMVNDLVFWLTVWLNFENVLLTFKWYVFMWQCSMLKKYANCHFLNKFQCVSMP